MMNVVSILILIVIVVVAIFVLTYVAHDRGSSMCSGCHGDCANCEGRKSATDKQIHAGTDEGDSGSLQKK